MSDDPPEPTPSPEEPAAAPAPLAPAPEEPAIRAPEASAAEAGPAPAHPVVVALKPASPLRRFAFLAIPAVAIAEILLHLVQTHTVVTDAEWRAARDAVRAVVQPADLVAMAPYWTDPIGREVFKDDILSMAREARPDATRFPRAIEVSIRGQHLAELASWKRVDEKKVGPVTLTILENPYFTPVKDDLVDHVAPGRMAVSLVGGNGSSECVFTHGTALTGPLGFGPAVPADRFTCPQGAMIGATVMQPGDYRPHRCLYTQPLGGGKTLRVRFLDVTFGDVLHGHAGLDWDSTAHTEEPPVTLTWKIGERTLARVIAGNEDGWKPFALDTRDLKGQRGEVVAEVSSPSSRNRLYCFEADTR